MSSPHQRRRAPQHQTAPESGPASPAGDGERRGGLGRIGWGIAWVVSLALAYLLGAQSRPGTPPAAQPAPSTSAPANQDPANQEPAAEVQPSQNEEVTKLLKSLPRRDPKDHAAKGKVDAKVILIEWSDYRCPFCSVWGKKTLPELQKYVDDGTLRIEFRDLAIFGEQSVNTAIAAHAAGRQGRFWEFQKAVYNDAPGSGHPDIDQAKIQEFARTAGVKDMARFGKDLTDPELKKLVMDSSRHAQRLGITGTPFFVINTKVISGAQPTENFIQAIEAAKQEG